MTPQRTHPGLAGAPAIDWRADPLGPDFVQHTIELGEDPDGEGNIVATLVARVPHDAVHEDASRAVLYVHGRSDYFFQTHVAAHFASLGYRFFALDLRKCGRSIRPGQTPHYIRNVDHYFTELDAALEIITAETALPVIVLAHSTGGLTTPLWLDARRRGRHPGAPADPVVGLVLNSPFFDLQGPPYLRSFLMSAVINTTGWVRSHALVPQPLDSGYGRSIHISGTGTWDFRLDWKPIGGFPIQFGWLRAIRQAQARLHRGIDVGVPTLILRSKLSRFQRDNAPAIDVADAVLDVTQIQRWAGCLGSRTTVVPIEDARHDVFLSERAPLERAFIELDLWLDWLTAELKTLAPPTVGASPQAGPQHDL